MIKLIISTEPFAIALPANRSIEDKFASACKRALEFAQKTDPFHATVVKALRVAISLKGEKQVKKYLEKNCDDEGVVFTLSEIVNKIVQFPELNDIEISTALISEFDLAAGEIDDLCRSTRPEDPVFI